jgi:hypothetical protein
MQQGAGAVGLADAGVGAGDEDGAHADVFRGRDFMNIPMLGTGA